MNRKLENLNLRQIFNQLKKKRKQLKNKGYPEIKKLINVTEELAPFFLKQIEVSF